MAGTFDTEAEYTAEIQRLNMAISRQLAMGKQSKNDSGGSSHELTEAELTDLRRYRRDLQTELNQFRGGCASVSLTASW